MLFCAYVYLCASPRVPNRNDLPSAGDRSVFLLRSQPGGSQSFACLSSSAEGRGVASENADHPWGLFRGLGRAEDVALGAERRGNDGDVHSCPPYGRGTA
jgi:hypothetical protein